jgi:Tfp pilus assembly protein PilF
VLAQAKAQQNPTDVTGDPAYEPLSKAFDALRAKDYDHAISFFEKAVSLSPARPDIRKNLAYTLLKTGDTDTARQQFGEAMRLDPADLHVALEYAFLCYEARENASARKAEARRIFARLRQAEDPEARTTAAQAFQNIDTPLESGIARWRQVLATTTPTFSAHYELAQLAEQRDELDLAAANYRAAFKLLPERRSVLIDLARVEKARGNAEEMMAALLAASRGPEPRAAELAREQLPDRYPFVYEFRNALELDPGNEALHRELAYLLLRMSENGQASAEEAGKEFELVVAASPKDYYSAAQLGFLLLAGDERDRATPILQNVLEHADAATANRIRMELKMPLVLEDNPESKKTADGTLDPRLLGERSYDAGFLKDAKRYFLLAHDQNPVDTSIALKLGWTTNMLHDDVAALHWFGLARHSADSAVAKEANRAWTSLRPGIELFRTTVWMYPAYSSRWSDLFGYGQIKTEMKVKSLPFRPYISMRFIGDARVETSGAPPQQLSESSFIFGIGIATRQWHGVMGWAEAGEAVSYLHGTVLPDYRGGASWSRTIGASIAAEHGGWFFETTADSVFVSRFDHDLINYSQNRAGMTSVLGNLKTQIFWANNFTFDVKRQYWANFAESGPGVRFHFPRTPPSMTLTLNLLHGVYLINDDNPRRPNFNDFRAGVWYAFTK